MPSRPPRRPLLTLPALAAAAWGVALAGCKTDIRDRDLQTIPVIEARRISTSQDAVIMDARPANAYAAGHIPGAINVRIDSIEASGPKNPAWAAAPAIIVYGEDGGSASAKAVARRLMEAEYGRVRLLEGGLAGWRGMGLEVESE